MATSADDRRYLAEVVDAALRDGGRRPDVGLAVRYRLPEALTPDTVATARAAAVQIWLRNVNLSKYRDVLRRFLAEDSRLNPVFTAASRGDLAPLRAALSAEKAEHGTAMRRIKESLAERAAGLSAIAPEDLERLAATHQVDPVEVAAAARAASILVTEPDRLPTRPPTDAYSRYRKELAVLDCPHLGAFLLPDTTAYRIFAGEGRTPLTSGMLADARARWRKRARGQDTKAADSVVALLEALVAAQGPNALDALMLYDVAAELRGQVRRGLSPGALRGFAADTLRLHHTDARRAAFAVVHEQAPELPARIRQLLDAGRPGEAVDLTESVPGADADGDVAALLAEARARAKKARKRLAKAREADEAGSPEAWELYERAYALDNGLTECREAQARLPVPPPTGLVCEPDPEAGRVRLHWQPSPASDTEHVVFRSVVSGAHPPPDNGTRMGTAHDNWTDTSAPPVALLAYSVVAMRGDTASEPCTARTVLLCPELRGLDVTAGSARVSAGWQLPPDAVGAWIVRRTDRPPRDRDDGTPVPAGPSGFVDTAVDNGTTYHYRIGARFRDAFGRPVDSPGVVRTVVPHLPLAPVRDLAVAADPFDPGWVVARFAAPPEGVVALFRVPAAPPWQPGDELDLDAVTARAVRLDTQAVDGGLRFRTPEGACAVLAATVAGARCVVGGHAPWLPVPVLGRVTAQHRGPELVVRFGWPGDASDVEIVWRDADGNPMTRIVDQAAWRRSDGIRLPVGPDAGTTIQARPAAEYGGRRVMGAPVRVHVPEPRVLRYAVAWRGLPGKRRVVVSVLSPHGKPVWVDQLLLVAAPGDVRPLRVEGTRVLARCRGLLVGGDPVVLFDVPAPDLPRPFWVLCLTPDKDLLLVDPPVGDLLRGRK